MQLISSSLSTNYCSDCKPSVFTFEDRLGAIHFNDENTLLCGETTPFHEQNICYCQCVNYPSFKSNQINPSNSMIIRNLPC